MLSKIYLCPADEKYACTWEGSSDDIFEHFSQEHEELLYFSESISINLDVTSENRLLLFDSEIYLLQTKINEEHLNIYLRYLGPAKIASNLTYDIDLLVNEAKVRKQDIELKPEGYFSISLECIKTNFGNVNSIVCQLMVNGNFTPNFELVDDNVFADDNEDTLEINEEISEENTENELELIKHLSPSLQNFLSSPKEENSLEVELREKPSNTNANRSTWYVTDSYLPKQPATLLGRSHTFTSEDIRRNSAIKRQTSMRSLGSIAEADLDVELKCTNCDTHLAKPIFLCDSGHNMCANCYRDNKFCIICDKEITLERNEDLENKALDHLYSCTNKRNGCHKKLPFNEIEEHELNCTFCQFLCPMEECGFNSGYKNMVAHLSLIHSRVKMFQSFIAVFQKHQEIFLANEMMGIFYCNWLQIDNNKIIWNAKYCGPKGRNFFCELKFKGKSFKKPLLLTRNEEGYFKEMEIGELKEHKLKAKNSILTITR